MENKPTSLLVVLLGRHLAGFLHVGVVDKWLATPKRTFLVIRDKYAIKFKFNSYYVT